MEKVIDAHLHIHAFPSIAGEAEVQAHPVETAALVSLLDARGVEKAFVHVLYEANRLLPVPASPRLAFSTLIDFRLDDAEEAVRKAKALGYRGIKFLTYEQKITSADYARVLDVVRVAEEAGLLVTICATYGGLGMYEYDPLRLAAHLLNQNVKAPLILAHAGGARVREAMLLVEAAKNVYLDTSFTTTFWKDSAVTRELREVIERYPNRVMFGSDHPAVEYAKAFADASAMLEGASDEVRRAYFSSNAERLIFI